MVKKAMECRDTSSKDMGNCVGAFFTKEFTKILKE
jgi:hypothetical protein